MAVDFQRLCRSGCSLSVDVYVFVDVIADEVRRVRIDHVYVHDQYASTPPHPFP